jgi:hypothetical protein
VSWPGPSAKSAAEADLLLGGGVGPLDAVGARGVAAVQGQRVQPQVAGLAQLAAPARRFVAAIGRPRGRQQRALGGGGRLVMTLMTPFQEVVVLAGYSTSSAGVSPARIRLTNSSSDWHLGQRSSSLPCMNSVGVVAFSTCCSGDSALASFAVEARRVPM